MVFEQSSSKADDGDCNDVCDDNMYCAFGERGGESFYCTLSEAEGADLELARLVGTSDADSLYLQYQDASSTCMMQDDDTTSATVITAEVMAGDGNDIIHGSPFDTSGYSDVLHGMGSDDTIYGHEGNDIIYGGDGDDDINAGYDTDTIFGGDGHDRINGDAGLDTIYGGAGHDEICSDGGHPEYLYGELGDDLLYDPTSYSGNVFDCGPGDYDLSSRYTAGDTVNCEGEISGPPGGECFPDAAAF